MAIESVNVASRRLSAYGIVANDYFRDGKRVDLQDLLTGVAISRAHAVEDEIEPLSRMMRNRNRRLDDYGELLAKLNKIETNFKDDDDGGKVSSLSFIEKEAELLVSLGANVSAGTSPSKADTQEYLQLVKAAIDGLNNRSQKDMTRLQGLVDRRDQSFTKAAELLKDVSDSRSKLMSALGG